MVLKHEALETIHEKVVENIIDPMFELMFEFDHHEMETYIEASYQSELDEEYEEMDVIELMDSQDVMKCVAGITLDETELKERFEFLFPNNSYTLTSIDEVITAVSVEYIELLTNRVYSILDSVSVIFDHEWN